MLYTTSILGKALKNLQKRISLNHNKMNMFLFERIESDDRKIGNRNPKIGKWWNVSFIVLKLL